MTKIKKKKSVSNDFNTFFRLNIFLIVDLQILAVETYNNLFFKPCISEKKVAELVLWTKFSFNFSLKLKYK